MYMYITKIQIDFVKFLETFLGLIVDIYICNLAKINK